jgi:hypothetical protein
MPVGPFGELPHAASVDATSKPIEAEMVFVTSAGSRSDDYTSAGPSRRDENATSNATGAYRSTMSSVPRKSLFPSSTPPARSSA